METMCEMVLTHIHHVTDSFKTHTHIHTDFVKPVSILSSNLDASSLFLATHPVAMDGYLEREREI